MTYLPFIDATFRPAGIRHSLSRDRRKDPLPLTARVLRVGRGVGVVLAPRGRLQRLLLFTFADGRIANAEVVADPVRLREIELSVFPD
jgi:hypothetical protein